MSDADGGRTSDERPVGPRRAFPASSVGRLPGRVRYVAAFSDSANVVNQIPRGWNKNERATERYEEVEEAFDPFKPWQLSWFPREMNREADK